MSNTERKKDIDNIVDLLERAKAMAEEMKSADDDTFNEMNDARQAEHENDAEVEATEEMKNLEASMEILEEAIDAMDDAIGAMLRAE